LKVENAVGRVVVIVYVEDVAEGVKTLKGTLTDADDNFLYVDCDNGEFILRVDTVKKIAIRNGGGING
jgi:hypothetical protein